jgi:hypothetical protein
MARKVLFVLVISCILNKISWQFPKHVLISADTARNKRKSGIDTKACFITVFVCDNMKFYKFSASLTAIKSNLWVT